VLHTRSGLLNRNIFFQHMNSFFFNFSLSCVGKNTENNYNSVGILGAEKGLFIFLQMNSCDGNEVHLVNQTHYQQNKYKLTILSTTTHTFNNVILTADCKMSDKAALFKPLNTCKSPGKKTSSNYDYSIKFRHIY